MEIKVFKITGEYALTADQGGQLYESICCATPSAEEKVKVDFSEVKVYTSTFCNHAIGQLLKNFTPSELSDSIDLINLPGHGVSMMREVIANAKSFYGHQ